jgi:hypothetical protein
MLKSLFIFLKAYFLLIWGNHAQRAFTFTPPLNKPFKAMSRKEQAYSLGRYWIGIIPQYTVFILVFIICWSPLNWEMSLFKKILGSVLLLVFVLILLLMGDLTSFIKHKRFLNKNDDPLYIFSAYPEMAFTLLVDCPKETLIEKLTLLSTKEIRLYDELFFGDYQLQPASSDSNAFVVQLNKNYGQNEKKDHLKLHLIESNENTLIDITFKLAEFTGSAYRSIFDAGMYYFTVKDILRNIFKEININIDLEKELKPYFSESKD